jgi:solute carrier family 12 sodium/potassium/chloride transporter 2
MWQRTEFHSMIAIFSLQIILFSGEPSDRPGLVDFANLITKNVSLLQCINVIGEEDLSWEALAANKTRMTKWLIENQIKAFYSVIRHHRFFKGAT